MYQGLQANMQKDEMSPQLQQGFYSPALSSGSQGFSFTTEHRKSSNKMPNPPYLISGTLTFSSLYLMVGFVCQTNVKNTIPQAQSLGSGANFSSFASPPLSIPSEREEKSSQQHDEKENEDVLPFESCKT